MPKKTETPPAPKVKRGRPRLQLNEKTIRFLASRFLSNEDIAVAMGCSADTLEKNYSGALNAGRTRTKRKVLSKLYDIGVKDGNVVVLMFLCRTKYGMNENKPELPPPPEPKGDTKTVYETEWGNATESSDPNTHKDS